MYIPDLKKLTEHVYYYYSLDKKRPLLACVVGEDQTLFIDAGSSCEHMQEMIDAYSRANFSDNLSKLGMITDSKYQHVCGMQLCNFPYIAHKLTQENLKEMQAWDWSDKGLDSIVKQHKMTSLEARTLKREIPDRTNLEIQIPCIIYRHQLEVDLTGVTCILEHIETDYTDESTILYVKEDKVLFLGDCMNFGNNKSTPCYSKKLFTLIDILLAYDAEYFIFSSEKKILDRNEFIEYCEYLRLLGATVSLHNDNFEAIEADLGKIKKEDIKYVHAFIEGLKRGI